MNNMERRNLILISAGAIIVVLLAGVGIYLLRNRSAGNEYTPSPAVSRPGTATTSTMPSADAIQAQRDAYASSTYEQRFQALSPEVQSQLTKPVTPRPPIPTASGTSPGIPAATSSPATMDPSADPDHDGLTNLQEQQLGTNPLNPDTDGDGLTDGQEVNIYHTDPLNPDTDHDGYTDGAEVKAGYNPNGPGKLIQ
jgi:hypothetical protein